MEDNYIIAQVFASIALISDTLSFQFKKRDLILICFIVSTTALSIHYFFLLEFAVMSFSLQGIFRFYLAKKFPNNYYLMIGFILLTLITGILMYSSIASIFGMIGVILFTIGVFNGDDKVLRIFCMVGTAFMILTNILLFSVIGILVESIFLSSNIIGFLRLYYFKKA